ncbi:hypothetical protein Csa_004814 [Cucumis sativus]|nr:hypothetical protein Csa_004814 [Cucumis sativus]
MNKKNVVIQVKNNMEERLTELVPVNEFGSSRKTIKPSIYKIPKFMKDIQPNADKPQLVVVWAIPSWGRGFGYNGTGKTESVLASGKG